MATWSSPILSRTKLDQVIETVTDSSADRLSDGMGVLVARWDLAILAPVAQNSETNYMGAEKTCYSAGYSSCFRVTVG